MNYVDPTGCDLTFTGDAAQEAFEFLRQYVSFLNLAINRNGKIYGKLKDDFENLDDRNKLIWEIISNSDINVEIKSTRSERNSLGTFLFGGAFMGSSYDEQNEYTKVHAIQEINIEDLKKLCAFQGLPDDFFHEISEAYQGGLIALQNKKSIGNGRDDDENYKLAHAKALPQKSDIKIFTYDSSGKIVYEKNGSYTGIPVKAVLILWLKGISIPIREVR